MNIRVRFPGISYQNIDFNFDDIHADSIKLQMINLIDQRAVFNKRVVEIPSANANIAIFGSQSSGKSTLMNYAFGTDFPTLDANKTRQQCTQGVWLQNVGLFNLIDTEGFDSIERARENTRIYQRQIALFCLAISDVIMVNIWMNQIGRYDGGQISMLKTIIKAASFLIKTQSKVLMFVVKDCTKDADHGILEDEIEMTVQSIIKNVERETDCSIKFNLEYYFISHYIYNHDSYLREAKGLASSIRTKASNLQKYEPKDRAIYLQQLWDSILSNQGGIDLRREEEALKIYIIRRVRSQVFEQVAQSIQEIEKLADNTSYQRFHDEYLSRAYKLTQDKFPKHLEQTTINTHLLLLQEQLQYIINKHFNEKILPKKEKVILNSLQKQLRKSYQSIQLEKIINTKRKTALQQYKFAVKGHWQANILVKRFAERITQRSVGFEKQVSHLFHMFQNKLQKQINQALDNQLRRIKFNGKQISNKVKSMCSRYQYKEWEINFREIWEKVSHRILTQKLFEKIEIESRKFSYGFWTADKQAEIIIGHKNIRNKCEEFISQLLQYFEQEDRVPQYLEKAREKIISCMQRSIRNQKKRFHLNILITGIFLIFLQSQTQYILKKMSVKKRNRYYFGNTCLLAAVLMILVSLVNKNNQRTKK